MIRLGRKYEISRFITTALARLRRLFPDNSYAWEISREAVLHSVNIDAQTLFDIIHLGYEWHIPSILPTAFLDMCAMMSLVSSRQHGGSSSHRADRLYYSQKLYQVLKFPLLREIRNPIQYFNIKHYVVLNCLQGRAIFVANFFQSVLRKLEFNDGVGSPYIVPHPSSCHDRPECETEFSRVLGHIIGMAAGTDPVNFLKDVLGDQADELCQQCQYIMKRVLNQSWEETWVSLPGYFNLPAWVDMKDFDEEDVQD